MALIYADTSALIKRQVSEQGSDWIRTWIGPDHGHTVITSEIAIPEGVSVLARLLRQRIHSLASFTRLRDDLLVAIEQDYVVIPITRVLLVQASLLVAQHPLRTLDAIHLAAAITVAQRSVSPPTFVAADLTLLTAASAEGFPTDNPNAH